MLIMACHFNFDAPKPYKWVWFVDFKTFPLFLLHKQSFFFLFFTKSFNLSIVFFASLSLSITMSCLPSDIHMEDHSIPLDVVFPDHGEDAEAAVEVEPFLL